MIRFSCRCGHAFEEPDNAAGMSVQCPDCLLLSDVPGHSVVQHIGLDESHDVDPPGDGSSLYELDNRPAETQRHGVDLGTDDADDEIVELADEEISEPVAILENAAGGAVMPIALLPPRPRPAAAPPIPFANQNIAYQANGLFGPGSFANLLLELVQPANLFVVVCVAVIHFAALALSVGLVVKLLFVLPVVAVLVISIFAHYGNVIDEIGVDGQDELPRVMRDLRLHEDVLWPVRRLIISLALAFGPPIGVLYLPIERQLAGSIAIALTIAGTFFFPAIWLTVQTSGSLANLRPDRILGVIFQTWFGYLKIVALFVAAAVPYVLALLSLTSDMVGQLGLSVPQIVSKLAIAVPLLCIGIFLMHAVCWELGLLYRAGNARFGWVSAYPRRETRAPLVRQKRRYYMPGPVVSRTGGILPVESSQARSSSTLALGSDATPKPWLL